VEGVRKSLDDKDAACAIRIAGGESVSLWQSDGWLNSAFSVVT
jgi:hypothetical protein